MAMLRGKVFWAKIVGKPSKAYLPADPREWSFDLALRDEDVSLLTKEGAKPYIKEPKSELDHDGHHYIRFKRKEVTAVGDPGTPYRIVDHMGQEWDGKTLIGNGSICNVKYNLNEQTMGKNKGAFKPTAFAIQVVKLEKYEASSEFPEYADSTSEEW